MQIDEYNNAQSHLLNAFNLCAPTGKEQRAMVSLVHEMEDAGETKKAILTAIACAIADGLRFGNWPKERA